MPALSTKTEAGRDVLLRVADSRLAEFQVLRAATPPCNAAALYLGGYAVEALLKCLICRTLNLPELPVLFHVHDLDVLLFYSGRYDEMRADAPVWKSFVGIQALWDEKCRYADPPTVSAAECDRLDLRLNDPASGVIPWLKARI
jgi:hypothetical protein